MLCSVRVPCCRILYVEFCTAIQYLVLRTEGPAVLYHHGADVHVQRGEGRVQPANTCHINTNDSKPLKGTACQLYKRSSFLLTYESSCPPVGWLVCPSVGLSQFPKRSESNTSVLYHRRTCCYLNEST